MKPYLSRAGWCKTWQNKSSVMSSSYESIVMFSSPWSQNNDYSSWVSYPVFHINKFMTAQPLFLLDVYLSVLYLMCSRMCQRSSAACKAGLRFVLVVKFVKYPLVTCFNPFFHSNNVSLKAFDIKCLLWTLPRHPAVVQFFSFSFFVKYWWA